MTEEQKYPILFSATILAARRLAEIGDKPCPAREACMEDAIRNAERILQKGRSAAAIGGSSRGSLLRRSHTLTGLLSRAAGGLGNGVAVKHIAWNLAGVKYLLDAAWNRFTRGCGHERTMAKVPNICIALDRLAYPVLVVPEVRVAYAAPHC